MREVKKYNREQLRRILPAAHSTRVLTPSPPERLAGISCVQIEPAETLFTRIAFVRQQLGKSPRENHDGALKGLFADFGYFIEKSKFLRIEPKLLARPELKRYM